MSSSAAASRVSASSSVLRVLLLATDPATGQVVVVEAR